MELFLGWIIFSIIAGVIAGTRNRNGFGYFLLSLALSPLVGLILAIALPALPGQVTRSAPTPATHIKCPDCRELILIDARVCKHCGCRLVAGGIPEGKIQCPDCWRLNDTREKYCSACGHALH